MRISDWSSDVCSSDLRIAVDEQGTGAEFELAELAGERLGLGILELERVEDDELAALRLVAQRHLEAEGANLLVQRVAKGASPRAVRLAAAAAYRSGQVAVPGGGAVSGRGAGRGRVCAYVYNTVVLV